MGATPIAQRKAFSSLSETLRERQQHGFSTRRYRERLERVFSQGRGDALAQRASQR
ncbi:hypothetical protein H1Q63_00525 [Desmonostoc muscorum CCALA 125]|nr:hypothetical protein [Desmonostoc muscorum CCALA 125]